MTTTAAGHRTDSSSVRRVVAGTAGQLAARVVHLALNVVSTLAIVRYLAPSAYGSYVLVLTVTGMVSLVSDFGLPKIAVREIAGSGTHEGELVGTIIGLRTALALAGIALIQVVLLLLGQPTRVLVAAGVASTLLLSEAVFAAVAVCFQVRLLPQVEAFLRTGAEALETAAILLLISAHAGLAWLFVPPAVGSVLGALVAYALIRRRFGTRPVFTGRHVRMLVRESLPVAPALVLSVLYRKLDGLSLAALRPSREVGLYGSVAQPVEYWFLTTALFINVAFPLLSRAYGRADHVRFRELYRRGAEILVIVTLVVPVALPFVAQPLIRVVYGDRYTGAAPALLLLSVAMVLSVVAVWQAMVLLVSGHQRVTLRYNLAAVLVTVVLCVALVGRFGLAGAGAAAVGTAAFVVAASTVAVRRHSDVRLDAGRLTRVAAAGAASVAVTGALAWADHHGLLAAPWPLLLATALVAYVLALLGVRAHHGFRTVFA
ncbi:flippase [Micromonospora sp. NBS 11-29]|uniref:flippase n=1 Tax=Micromonospora sp. NBS 11-29 TaxID=1960879 RepID=UPI000B788B77|nr:flippase [Micromonospora sp. NBS 11-29]